MSTSEKLVIIVTHGPEEPELATLPFVVAVSALVSDVGACLVFQADGVNLLRKGGTDGVQAPSFPPLAELYASFVELGGQILACSPCLLGRSLEAPDDLEPGVEVIGAARLVTEITAATATLTY
jgi:predicted peroxiredoxin